MPSLGPPDATVVVSCVQGTGCSVVCMLVAALVYLMLVQHQSSLNGKLAALNVPATTCESFSLPPPAPPTR